MLTNAKKLGKITHTFLAERCFYMQPNGGPEAFSRRQGKQLVWSQLHQGPQPGRFGLEQAWVSSLDRTRPVLFPWELQ